MPSVNSASSEALTQARENGPGPDLLASAAEGLGVRSALFNYRGAFSGRLAGMGDVSSLGSRGPQTPGCASSSSSPPERSGDESLTPSRASSRIRALEFDVQADVVDGQEYRPGGRLRIAVLAVRAGLSQL